MIISFNSLKLLLNNLDKNLLKELLQTKFIENSFEIESIKSIEKNWQGLIVGKLIDYQWVPDSKKLKICQIFDGQNNLSIICGGPDLQIGKNYILAPIGSTVGNLKILERKVFNQLSHGMICGWEEIGINLPGMSLIDDDFIPGTPLESVYDMNFFEDEIYDIKITTNRPDCLSIMGIAREIQGLSEKKFTLNTHNLSIPSSTITNDLSIDVQTTDCQYFYSTIIKNVNNYTPLWMKLLLQNLGFKSINLPVDISNFLLAKYGHPTHVYQNLSINNGWVKFINNGLFYGLDDKSYTINYPTIALVNNDNINCLMGIMGGKNSSYQHQELILEIANFNPLPIYKSQKYLGINTKASFNFSRWVDPNLWSIILKEFIYYLNGPHGINNIIISNTINHCNHSFYQDSKQIILSYELWYKIAGFGLSLKQQQYYLNLLDIPSEIHKNKKNDGTDNYDLGLLVTVPHWRSYDIIGPENIVEEIIRMYGINQQSSQFINKEKYHTIEDKEILWNKQYTLLNLLINQGYKQNIHNIFSSDPGPISLKTNKTFLKTTLLKDLIQSVQYSINHGYKNILLTEIGEIVGRNNEISIACGGILYNHDQTQEYLYHQGKIHIENLLINLLGSLKNIFWDNLPNDHLYFHKNKSVVIYYKDEIIGYLGVINPSIKINEPWILWELLNINQLFYQPIPLSEDYLKSIDISFFIDKNQSINQIIKELYNHDILNMKIVDIYHHNDELSYTLKIFWKNNNINNDNMMDMLQNKLISLNCINR